MRLLGGARPTWRWLLQCCRAAAHSYTCAVGGHGGRQAAVPGKLLLSRSDSARQALAQQHTVEQGQVSLLRLTPLRRHEP